jgi:hypothetical protein
MSSSSAEQTFALLRDRSIGSSPQLLLKQALDTDMPPGVKRYLLTEVAGFLEKDLRNLPHFGRLHPDAPGIGSLRLTFLRSLAGSYEMSRDQYLKLLQEAVAFTESYVTRPQWTLESFLFEEEDDIGLETLRARIAYCADYAYFGRLLEEVLSRRRATHVTRADFRTLIARIDDQIIQQHSPRELALLAKPLFDFLLLKEAGPDEAVPLAPVLAFFDDKKMKILREYVESICRLRETTALSMNQLRQLIEDLESVKTEGDRTVEKKGVETPEAANALQASLAPGAPDSAEGDGGHPFPDLRNLIGEKQRQRFIRHVFNRDQAYFLGVLGTLNTLRTWEEAAAYLKQVYSINRLDPFSATVVEFTDLIQHRFSNEPESPR